MTEDRDPRLEGLVHEVTLPIEIIIEENDLPETTTANNSYEGSVGLVGGDAC